MPRFYELPHLKQYRVYRLYFIFTAFLGILTKLPMSERIVIWCALKIYVLIYSCEILSQCRNFFGSYVQKGGKNGIYTAFCSILANFPIRSRHEIWWAYSGHIPACPWQISRQCYVFMSGHIWCCTEYPILTSFLQYIRVYWQSYRWARDLKFGMHLRYMF